MVNEKGMEMEWKELEAFLMFVLIKKYIETNLRWPLFKTFSLVMC
jgi:hypothetical protein